MGSPVYHFDHDTHSVIAASMVICPKSAPSKSNGDDSCPHDQEIMFFSHHDMTNPIARCGSDVWEKDNKTFPQPQPWFHPFTRDMLQVAQVVEIKHYPRDVIKGNMRVIIVIAFGRRAHPPVNNPTGAHILGVWLMLKVIELRVPMNPLAILPRDTLSQYSTSCVEIKQIRDCVRINPDDVVNYESIEPRQNQITMHGRVVKLYSALRHLGTRIGRGQESIHMDVDTSRTVDCIAIFGTQDTDTASAMVIRKVLFRDGDQYSNLDKKTYSNRALSQGVSRMTLFPDRSGYEHLLVLFNQNGIDMIWDWINDKQIPQLRMPFDDKCAQRIRMALLIRGVTAGSNLVGNDGVIVGAQFPRCKVHYWGVQVSSDLDTSFTNGRESANDDSTFRILTMADGTRDEWESCWWVITGDCRLGPSSARTTSPTSVSEMTVPTNPSKIDLRTLRTSLTPSVTSPFTDHGGTSHINPSVTRPSNVPLSNQRIHRELARMAPYAVTRPQPAH
ncbi:hypothetical protein BGZ95_004942 [Linnemannia exigua]|uniref:Uncharacterized protein n=1 Tax=Linnemannia exigua TaxID=604196 RepID=A0AAD4D2G0_9FUNG|nr:hypothetical protein BGZ95_004942 [Linnemannia exigua]